MEQGTEISRPLQVASFHNHPEIVKYLIESGADVNGKGNETALHASCRKGNVEVVEILLENQADPEIKSKEGKTPKSVAMENNHQDIVQLLNNQYAYKLLYLLF